MRKLAPLVSLICAAVDSGVACEHAIARQPPRTETLLTGIPQVSMPINQSKGSKTIALESLGKTGAAVVGGPVAGAAAPYMEAGAAKAARFGKSLLSRHGGEFEQVEFDALAGATADVSFRTGNLEIVVPLNQYVTPAQALPEEVRPVILKLDVDLKHQVRILAARHIVLKKDKKGRFDFKPAVERSETEVDEFVIPSSFERLPETVYRIRTTEPLAAAEYALVFRTKAKDGNFTRNVALKVAKQGCGGRDASRQNLADLMNGGSRTSELPAKPTAFIAFDFRVSQ
jgi:hypothetical protein